MQLIMKNQVRVYYRIYADTIEKGYLQLNARKWDIIKNLFQCNSILDFIPSRVSAGRNQVPQIIPNKLGSNVGIGHVEGEGVDVILSLIDNEALDKIKPCICVYTKDCRLQQVCPDKTCKTIMLNKEVYQFCMIA